MSKLCWERGPLARIMSGPEIMFLSPASPPSLLRSFGGLEASTLLKPPKLHRSVGG